jgi:hypothetical protein
VNEDLERIANTMEYLRKTGCYPDGSRPVCILCGGRKVAGIDLFFPHDSQKFGAPQGLVRAVIFVFCRRCVDLPDRDQRAEAQLLAEARVQ